VSQDLGYTTSVDGKSKTGVTTANSQSMKSLPMMSAVKPLDWSSGSDLSPTVSLTRLVARVALTSLAQTFSGPYSGGSFTPTEVFMYNASNQLTNWSAQTVSGNVSGENISANANSLYLGSGTISTYSDPYYFYVFPHGSTNPTKLVIKGTFKTNSGSTYTTYYPITVNSTVSGNITSTVPSGTGDSKISSNTTYGLSVTLNGTGVANVSDELTPTNVTVTTSVADYTSATVSEYFGPSVGDLYYSDGSYSNYYYSNKIPIGVVVSLNSTYCEPLKGYGHGLVMALTEANAGCSWGTYTDEDVLLDKRNLASYYNDVSGLTNTKSIAVSHTLSTTVQSGYPAFYYAYLYYNNVVAAPNTSSGWFLPSEGQWWDAMEKAAKKNNITLGLEGLHSGTSYYYTNSSDQNNAYESLNKLFSIYQGLVYEPLKKTIYASSSEYNYNDACFVTFVSGSFISANDKGANKCIRPFLAF